MNRLLQMFCKGFLASYFVCVWQRHGKTSFSSSSRDLGLCWWRKNPINLNFFLPGKCFCWAALEQLRSFRVEPTFNVTEMGASIHRVRKCPTRIKERPRTLPVPISPLTLPFFCSYVPPPPPFPSAASLYTSTFSFPFPSSMTDDSTEKGGEVGGSWIVVCTPLSLFLSQSHAHAHTHARTQSLFHPSSHAHSFDPSPFLCLRCECVHERERERKGERERKSWALFSISAVCLTKKSRLVVWVLL